jgi:hypothetical protein
MSCAAPSRKPTPAHSVATTTYASVRAPSRADPAGELPVDRLGALLCVPDPLSAHVQRPWFLTLVNKTS